jgi:hypothetical protein
MFKKITSNRDPRDTVFSELGKEFRPYVSKMRTALKKCAHNYPRFLFWMMVINISLSVILVTTVFRPTPEPKKSKPPVRVSPVSQGFDQIMQAGFALKQTIRLKREVDSLTRINPMSNADSIRLLKDLDSLQHIAKPFNTPNHEN